MHYHFEFNLFGCLVRQPAKRYDAFESGGVRYQCAYGRFICHTPATTANKMCGEEPVDDNDPAINCRKELNAFGPTHFVRNFSHLRLVLFVVCVSVVFIDTFDLSTSGRVVRRFSEIFPLLCVHHRIVLLQPTFISHFEHVFLRSVGQVDRRIDSPTYL